MNVTTSKLNEKYVKNLVCFLFGRITSELGTSIFMFALSLHILDITGSATIFSTILSVGMLPSIFVNIFAGIGIDRGNKKKIMVACDCTSAVCMIIFFLTYLKVYDSILLLGVYSIVLSTIQSVFSLTVYSSIPNLFAKDKIMKINSDYQAVGAVVNILGPVLGGVLYYAISFKYIIIIEIVTFVLSALSELLFTYKKNIMQDNNKFSDNFRNVYGYISREKIIFNLLTIVLIVNFVFIPLTSVLLPYYGYKVMELSSTALGSLQASWSVGVIIGAVFASIKLIQSKLCKLIFRFLQLQGVVILLWLIPSVLFNHSVTAIVVLVTFGGILLVGGLFNSIINIPMMTYLQVAVPENIRASIYGVVNTCVMIAAPIGIWLYGIIIDKMNISIGVVISGVIILITSTLACHNKGMREFFAKEIKD